MDPLSVISAAFHFASAAYKIYAALKTIKNAPHEACDLGKEISATASLLQSLEEVPEFLHNDVLEFKLMLDQMNDRIKVLETQKVQQIQWPFKHDETQNNLQKIEHYKATFNLALTAKTAY